VHYRQLLIICQYAGFFEAISIAKGWAKYEETKGTLGFLKDDYIPVRKLTMILTLFIPII
jgi:hypothetical protein